MYRHVRVLTVVSTVCCRYNDESMIFKPGLTLLELAYLVIRCFSSLTMTKPGRDGCLQAGNHHLTVTVDLLDLSTIRYLKTYRAIGTSFPFHLQSIQSIQSLQSLPQSPTPILPPLLNPTSWFSSNHRSQMRETRTR